MKIMRYLALLPLVVLALACPAEGAWRVDPERLHVAAHGRLSCRDCHEEAAGRRPHPDPAAVNRKPNGALGNLTCAACHDDVLAQLEQGRHGAAQAAPGRPPAACVACHDPHYAPSSSAPAGAEEEATPPEARCRLCHDFQASLPPPGPQDAACMACHERPAAADPDEPRKTEAFCMGCHGAEAQNSGPAVRSPYPLLDRGQYAATPHSRLSCAACHPDSERYGHGGQVPADCRGCHFPHRASTANEVHLGVACAACHLSGAKPVRDRVSGGVGWVRTQTPGVSEVHRMALPDHEQSCARCHFSRNGIGAPAAILPPKGVLCLPCHTATFSVGDAVTAAALVVFALGLIAAACIWAAGRDAPHTRRHAPLPRAAAFRSALAGLVLDGVLQRRLFRYSRRRWFVHALVFIPFMLRFGWGLAAFWGSQLIPQSRWVWKLLDPNEPVTAFVFDLSGLAVLAGAGIMVLRRLAPGESRRPSGLPPADWAAYALLGAVMASGFLLEGVRIAMTGHPPGSAYAFVGDGISRFFHGAAGLDDLYGYLWYGHAVLMGLFVAYLPFSRMFHIILAPLVLALRPFSAR